VKKQLRAVTDSLESAQSRLRRLSDKISDEKWSKHPGAGGWSAAECIEHLNLTSKAYLPLLRDAVARARKSSGPPRNHYRRDPLGWFMSTMIGPLRHLGKFRVMRVKTTPPFVPKAGGSRDQILSDFVRMQAELIAQIQSGDGLPLDRVKIVSPFGGRMKYSAYSALIIVARHQHRHIQQAEEAAA
jgi:DinB family protein